MNVSRLMRGVSAVLVALGLVTGAVSTASFCLPMCAEFWYLPLNRT